MRNARIVGALLGLVALVGCSDEKPQEATMLPDRPQTGGALAPVGPAPSGFRPDSQNIKWVSEAELAELRKDDPLVPANQPPKDRHTQLEQNLAAAAGYLGDHPEAANRLKPAIQNARAGAGTGPHPITLTSHSGQTKPVLLMDDYWTLNSALKWMAVVETKTNQLGLFKILKHQFPDGHLPDHTPLATDDEAAAMSAEQLVELNSKLTPEGQQSSSGAVGLQAPTAGAAYAGAPLGHPNQEYGVHWGMDLESLEVNSPQVGYAANGIMRFAPKVFPHTGQYTPNFSNVTSVKDQGPRGTCTAFATASAIEATALTSFSLPTNLSEQALYGFGLLGDTSVNDGYYSGDYLSAMGNGSYSAVPYEASWDYNRAISRWSPYTTPPFADSCDGYGSACSETIGEDPLVCTSSQCFYAYPVPANDGIKVTSSSAIVLPTAVSVLQMGYPVILEFTTTSDFEHPGAGGYVNYTGNSTSLGGHAVHAVGYLTNLQVVAGATLAGIDILGVPLAAGGGYFIIKNSWGDGFGDGGYVYVPYSYVQQNLTAAYSINDVAFVGAIAGIPSGISSQTPLLSLPSPSLALGSHPGSFVISNVGTGPSLVDITPANSSYLALTTGPSESTHIFVLTPGWSYAQGVSYWANMPPGSYSTGVGINGVPFFYGYESVTYTVPKPPPTPPPCINPHTGCRP
jgi:hypothetical protein